MNYPVRFHSLRQGITLVELLVVLVIMATILGFGIARWEQSGEEDMADVVREIVLELNSAKARAVASGQTAYLFVDEAGGAVGAGTWAVEVVPSGVVPPAPAANRVRTLPRRIGWGLGAATVGPIGDSATAAVPVARLACDAWGKCVVPAGSGTITYYLYSDRKPSPSPIVGAFTIGSMGEARAWTYDASSDRWF